MTSMMSEGLWCPVIFVPYNEKVVVFTTRGMTLARHEGEVVDFPVTTFPTEKWFHQLYIQTCYVQIVRH